MSADDKRNIELEALQSLLDSHGGDADRWPALARERFGGLIASDDAARMLVAEARALDAVLMRAPTVSDARRRALADRIVAAAKAAEPPASIPVQDRVVDLAAERRLRAAPPLPQQRSVWQAAGILAASLIAGIVIGVSGMGSSLGDLTSLFNDTDTLTATLSLAVDGPDEDVL